MTEQLASGDDDDTTVHELAELELGDLRVDLIGAKTIIRQGSDIPMASYAVCVDLTTPGGDHYRFYHRVFVNEPDPA